MLGFWRKVTTNKTALILVTITSLVLTACSKNPLSSRSGSDVGDSYRPGLNIEADLTAPTATGIPTWANRLTASTLETSTLTWTAATDTVGVARYEVALGTTVGGDDISTWQSVGTQLSYDFRALSLTNGSNYIASVRAVDAAGNVGPVTSSNAVTVMTDTKSLELNFTTMTKIPPMMRFTRSSASGFTGTYFDSTGVMRLAPINFLLQNEAFENASWTKTSATPIANVTTDPGLGTSADALNELATTAVHSVSQSVAGLVLGRSYTLSVYAKANVRSAVALTLTGAAFTAAPIAVFNLANGTIVSTGGGAIASTMTGAGDGWYRITLTANAGANGAGVSNIQLRETPAGPASYAGVAASGIYLWGAQLENSPAATSLIYTTTAANGGVRFDHDPTKCVNGVCESIGIRFEQSRNNRVYQSENLTTASWNKINTVVALAAANSPMDTMTGNSLVESSDSVATTHEITQAALSIAASVKHSASVYVKPHGRKKVQLSFNRTAMTTDAVGLFDLEAGTVTTSGTGTTIGGSIEKLANGWARLELFGVVSTAASTAILHIALADDLGNTSYIGNGTSGLYVWGVQFEQGGRASTYMPTTGTLSSRGADSGTMSSISSWAPNNVGTIFIEGNLTNDDTVSNTFPLVMRLCQAADSNNQKQEIQIYNGRPVYVSIRNGGPQYNTNRPALVSSTERLRMMFAFEASNFRAATSGALHGLGGSGLPSAPDQFQLTNSQFNLRKLHYWPLRLTDNQIEAYSRE